MLTISNRARRLYAAALAPLALAACDSDGISSGLEVVPVDAPAAAGSAQPSLAAGEDGRVYLTWHEPAGDSASVLRMAVLRDSAWSEPTTIARDRDFIVNWADFPSLVPLGGERLAAHWLEREGDDTYAYGVRVAISEDGGRSWSAPTRPHGDSTQTEHGFVAMLPGADGVDAIWLDGRAYATERQEMTLRTALVGADGVSGEMVLDARVCDCCQTDAAQADSGAVVVYRDRSDEEIRDIAILRRVAGQWTTPAIVHEDGWEIDGCPVNGPAVAARGNLVAVAWFSAARDTAKVQLAFSRDGGGSFGLPFRIDGGRPGGRVDVALVSETTAIVSWIEETDPAGSGELRVRAVEMREAAPAPPTTIAAVSAARASGFPRMVLAGEDLVVAWTDVAERRVRVARVRL